MLNYLENKQSLVRTLISSRRRSERGIRPPLDAGENAARARHATVSPC